MPLDQTQYQHAMDLDTVTDKPMPKVAATLTGSIVIQPIDIQSRLASTIQTHNAVSVGATSGNSQGSWFDCDGFTDIAINLMNDAGTANQVNIDWSTDGTNQHGSETPLGSSPLRYRSAVTSIKARYARVTLFNTDASAHTMSAWAYLKA